MLKLYSWVQLLKFSVNVSLIIKNGPLGRNSVLVLVHGFILLFMYYQNFADIIFQRISAAFW